MVVESVQSQPFFVPSHSYEKRLSYPVAQEDDPLDVISIIGSFSKFATIYSYA